MKKTFKNLILTSMLFLGSALAYNADAGYWLVKYCEGTDVLLTYEAEYIDDDAVTGVLVISQPC